MHTIYSDGFLTPEELTDKAVRAGISVISITDHDSVRPYKNRSFPLKVIPGVELTVQFEKKEFHLLAYNFDPEHKEIKINTWIKFLTNVIKELNTF